MITKTNLLFGIIFICLSACSHEQESKEKVARTGALNSFEQDIEFLSQYTTLHLLEDSSGQGTIAISPALQARVMTSSASGMQGVSFGWINRELFASGDTLPHINPYGGEERFWLGPEGGQFALFFQKGSGFDLDNWQTPVLIDLEPFQLISKTTTHAEYSKQASITNYSGFVFDLDIRRRIEILELDEVFGSLELEKNPLLKAVGYRTTNIVTNIGENDWKKDSGLISIWLLGMFTPSDATTVLVPFVKGDEQELGPEVNDNYFGKVPLDRLKIGDGVIFFKGDGKARGKIGLSANRAKDIIGSYDAVHHILTVVKYSKPDKPAAYVNSLWEIQEQPYHGDVVNSYNDGPLSPAGSQMGPFYELESSSPALALQAGESGTHTQTTYHFEGSTDQLDAVAQILFGVTLQQIASAF